MKTPREILLGRHQAAAPQLDAVRKSIVAGLNTPAAYPQARRRSVFELLGELLRIPKPALAGLGLAWLIVIVLNLASREPGPMSPAPAQLAQRLPATREELREQKRLFAELVGAHKDADAEAPRFVPRPRGEAQPRFVYV